MKIAINKNSKTTQLTAISALALLLAAPSFAQGPGGHGGGGNQSGGGSTSGFGGGGHGAPTGGSHGAPTSRMPTTPRPSSGGHSVFPSYPRGNATSTSSNLRNRPAVNGHPATPTPSTFHPASREDHIGNRVTDDHMNRVNFANQRSANVMRTSPHVNNQVAYHSAAYASTLRPVYERKSVVYQEHFNQYHNVIVEHPMVWRDWHAHHFYGGFYYGFHPVADISIYYYNPMVHWFYVGTWDDAYYRTWYANEYEAYPALNHPFNFYGVYYPTDNLRQLLFGVSAMPVDKQAHFRSGITQFTQKITQNLANYTRSHVALSNGDIVITHYEILGNDDGVDVEGTVNFSSKAYNFKGFINLDEENQSQVFVTGNGDSNPNPDQLRQLDELNHSIDTLRGEASPQPPSEPRSVGLYPTADATPAPTEAPASAEVTADPK